LILLEVGRNFRPLARVTIAFIAGVIASSDGQNLNGGRACFGLFIGHRFFSVEPSALRLAVRSKCRDRLLFKQHSRRARLLYLGSSLS
jgi:hypothetical protein